MTGPLTYALFEYASRTRLCVLIPDIATKFPIKIHNFGEFADQIEMVEEMHNLYRDTVRRFGIPTNITERTAACVKTVSDRRYNSPYLKQIFVKKPRFYKICRVLPTCITKVIFTDEVIRQEMFNSL